MQDSNKFSKKAKFLPKKVLCLSQIIQILCFSINIYMVYAIRSAKTEEILSIESQPKHALHNVK